MKELASAIKTIAICCHEIQKNGLLGEFIGFRFRGKTYDADGNEIYEIHEEDCWCCRVKLIPDGI